MQMMPRLFVGIAVAAVVSLAAAVGVYTASDRWVSGEISGEAAFPQLGARANDAAEIEIVKGGKSLEMVRDGKRWMAKGDYGYPVKDDVVRAMIIDLAEAELVDPKTRKPEKYKLLDLGDPAKKGSEARSVRVLDAKGETLAEAVLGKKRYGAFGSEKTGTYVRKPGDPQTWLATLDFDRGADITEWVETRFFTVDIEDVEALTLEYPGNTPLTIARKAGAGDDAFELTGLGEDVKLKEDGASARSVVQAYRSIELDDLRKRSEPPAGEADGVSRLKTKDGLSVTFRYRKDGKDGWITITAQGSGDTAAKADALNARVKDWEFKVPGWKADKLFTPRSQFLETS